MSQEAQFEVDREDLDDDGITLAQDLTAEQEADILRAWLDADAEVVRTRKLQIASWTERLGQPFYVTVRELKNHELTDIFSMFEDSSQGKRGRGRKSPSVGRPQRDNTEIMAHIVAAGLVDPDIKPHLGGSTPVQFIQMKFRTLEITTIAEEILDLSGGGDDAVVEAKN